MAPSRGSRVAGCFILGGVAALLLLLEFKPNVIGLEQLTWRHFGDVVARRFSGDVDARRLQLGMATGSDKDSKKEKKDCVHGVYNIKNKTCTCDAGWSAAGITDTIHFLEGVCEQYKCENNEMCEEVMNIPGAWCPIRGWNCYCGWGYAFSNYGQGYETPKHQHGGKCMGIMYTFSIFISVSLKNFMTHAWKAFFYLALFLSPYGRKRANCDHHRPSLWRGIRKCFGCPSQCRGECVNATAFSILTLQDDFAWSIYAVDLGLWTYLFMVTLWVVAESIWSIVLWVLVMLIIIVSIIFGMIAMCGECVGTCDASACGCDCCAGAGADGCMDCCGVFALHTGHSTGTALSADAFYWGGTFPVDPMWGSSGYGSSGGNVSCCGCCSYFCLPIAWLLYVFPAMPENMWGGFVGYFIFGTHIRTPPEHLYQGGNAIIEFMGMAWRRTADLHADDIWRDQVYQFLTSEVTTDGGMGVGMQNMSQYGRQVGSQTVTDVPYLRTMEDGVQRRMVQIGPAHVVLIEKVFEQIEHGCVKSSYEDYTKNECWICTGGNEDWDLWLSCKHLFCKACSTEMLSRKMPCPLCRVSSSTVLRGKAFDLEEYQRRERERILENERIEREKQDRIRREEEEVRLRREAEQREREEARIRETKAREEQELRGRQRVEGINLFGGSERRILTPSSEAARGGNQQDRIISRGDSLTDPLIDRHVQDVQPEVITPTVEQIPLAKPQEGRATEKASDGSQRSKEHSSSSQEVMMADLLGDVEQQDQSSTSKSQTTPAPMADLLGDTDAEEIERVAREEAERLNQERAEQQRRLVELEKMNKQMKEKAEREAMERRNRIKQKEQEDARRQAEATSPPRVQIGTNFPVVTAESGIDIAQVLAAKPFKEWVDTIGKERRFLIIKIHIQSVDMFGPKIGFVKFTVVAKADNKQIPGIVFMRGGAVAILVLLRHEDKVFTLVVRQARVPVCLPSMAEIPAGMLDGDGNFAGVAAKEMKEETGIHIAEKDLIDMTQMAFENRFPGIFPSCGASDEFKRIFLYQRTVTRAELEDLNGRLTGVAEEGEMIKLQIVPLESLWRISPDAKALAALTLYEKLKVAGRLPEAQARQDEPETVTSLVDLAAILKNASLDDIEKALCSLSAKNQAKLVGVLDTRSSEATLLKPLTHDFDVRCLGRIKLLAADLDKTLYPSGMGNAKIDPSPAAREEFDKNIEGFMDFMKNGGLAIPVTGNSPALAQRKFDRSRVSWIVEDHPGVFCNGSLILGVKGVLEYSAPVPTIVMKQLQAWARAGDGFFEFEGNKYPFAVNCMTKSRVLYLPPNETNSESQKIADGWASMQLMTSEIAEIEFDWEASPAYQVNILLKNKADLLQDLPALNEDPASSINKIQTALLDNLEENIGKLNDAGCLGKNVLAPWCETNILLTGVNKGQSLNRFIHCMSVKEKIGIVNVGTDVMVAGDAANDLPMFVEWSRVDDFNGEPLEKTERPSVRIIMPDAEDEKLYKESNLKNQVHEVLSAIPKAKVVPSPTRPGRKGAAALLKGLRSGVVAKLVDNMEANQEEPVALKDLAASLTNASLDDIETELYNLSASNRTKLAGVLDTEFKAKQEAPAALKDLAASLINASLDDIETELYNLSASNRTKLAGILDAEFKA